VTQPHSQARPLTGSSSFVARRTLTGPSISLSINLHPQISSRDPSFFTYRGIRTRNFASPKVKRCTLESPRPDTSVNAHPFLYPLETFSIGISTLAVLRNLVLWLPSLDMPKLWHTCEWTIQSPLHSIALRSSRYRES